jgi:hypothetical protein
MYRKLIFASVFVAVLALASVPVYADTTSAGGVNYTLTNAGSDGPGVFDVMLTIATDPTGSIETDTLTSFSLTFTGATNVSVESSPDGLWASLGQGPNTDKGCNINGSADHWCFSDVGGTGITFTQGTAEGPFTFLFDVTVGSAPTTSHVQAFQGTGLAISNDVGVGTTPPSVPEPSSLMLLGTGLIGLAGFVRRKVTAQAF